MQRYRYYEYGGPEVLTLERDAERPEPGPGQVLVRTELIGANFVDAAMRGGVYQGSRFDRGLPGVPTGDVVGVVEAVGPGADGSLTGRRVAGIAEDAFAEYALIDADWLVAVPDGLAPGDAGMLAMGAPVALRALRVGRLAKGETVLINAAAGGIGHLALQLARELGAGTVIATAGSPAKLDFTRSLGADHSVDYTRDDWTERIRAAAPRGVDLVLDLVGRETLIRSLDLLAPLGRAVTYGSASGAPGSVPSTSLFPLRSLIGFSLYAWRAADPEQARQDLADAADHFTTGRLRTTVHATLPFAEAPEAHRILDSRENLGRVLLTL